MSISLYTTPRASTPSLLENNSTPSPDQKTIHVAQSALHSLRSETSEKSSRNPTVELLDRDRLEARAQANEQAQRERDTHTPTLPIAPPFLFPSAENS